MSDLILETKTLSKKFGNQYAVDNVSLKIKRNTIYGLLGPNGAGKTTILKMITGLLRPTSGEIIFDNMPWRRDHLAEIGSLIETPALYGNLTAVENLMIHTRLLGISKEKIHEVLEMVDLLDTGKKRVSNFSMGMKQRLGIAIALLGEPKLLILDEPNNGLDPAGVQKMRDLVTSFPKRGITVILSSHILSEVSQVVDDIGIISYGKLLFQGMPNSNETLENFYMQVIKGGIER
ncbi:lantibiotic protection ABC transporter ATP-binding protein [Peptostreptococcus canis]|uniref:Lantibiotic protection ABC transporter ATP-binding protein n=1 Tax=Peptostreptococcus canis TaxID=1159213 RepID=A0ABR6TLJ9_9FIRM|nr:lantibiotic protection ABC transporter ATP-binding protein [Peptostreptococcus canis]MBC2576284.1 lantibiotic protection ABC transporter ATP-binding protein [Peptostreptococcus canis]MBP1998479.1 ABC-2 type transport system ATP-binding protein [Peptostreptococcus canis]